jgi:hypothetical protein
MNPNSFRVNEQQNKLNFLKHMLLPWRPNICCCNGDQTYVVVMETKLFIAVLCKLIYIIHSLHHRQLGTADGGTVVKVLCYKSEGRWFDSRWCHLNISLP